MHPSIILILYGFLVCKCWLKVHESRLFCELSVFISSVTAINPETTACLAAFLHCTPMAKTGKLGALHLNISKPLNSLIGASFSS